ncbi:PREDICTED: prothymosin alpha-B-like [Dinoponera quadriceps]|uniref:Prothymosin alpha-B-like n=1 Tax=Dinoponera quadriceps TaxID=609295 RepID=A0A6P3WXD1_DINQU|nr:PREDICTED: prothymosin alpha-B-like [Dinoponera quadriceps]
MSDKDIREQTLVNNNVHRMCQKPCGRIGGADIDVDNDDGHGYDDDDEDDDDEDDNDHDNNDDEDEDDANDDDDNDDDNGGGYPGDGEMKDSDKFPRPSPNLKLGYKTPIRRFEDILFKYDFKTSCVPVLSCCLDLFCLMRYD